MEFYASCPEGFEQALSDELNALNVPQVRKLKGRVSFGGELATAQRVCLWSRLASRVFVVLKRFACENAQDLYEGARAMAWEDIVRGHTIAVTGRGTNRALRNSHYAALCVKDAICDRMISAAGRRPDIDTDYPDARIALSLRGNRASIHLDLSGEPLFKRLPRAATRPNNIAGSHVLRPDYAALILAEAGWPALCASSEQPILIDAGCAGGGVVLEAARIMTDVAPGLMRSTWGFEGWQEHDDAAWSALLNEADERAERGRSRHGRIVACGTSDQAASFAQRVIASAHLAERVTFLPAQASKIARKLGIHAKSAPLDAAIVADVTEHSLDGCGQSLSVIAELRGLPALESAQTVVLTRNQIVERALGTRARAARTVKPNNEDARLLHFDGAAQAENILEEKQNRTDATSAIATVEVGDNERVAVLVPESDQFAARLRKVARQRRKWARREQITCYRVYDADLPDYAVAIDLYQNADDDTEKWLVIAEYAAPKSVDASLAQARLLDVLTISQHVFGISRDHIFARERTRSRGGSQYARSSASVKRQDPLAQAHAIREGGLSFLVNFDSYLDTGIFLDHRVTRSLVRSHARGARFLNLFAYTGTATCYAADGGAASTTTVDMSNTYLGWAERNMRANGFSGRAHRFIRADVLAWVMEQRRASRTWDLIFCDPPTFSNSSKMGERTWDVQRDHAELIENLVTLLAAGGELIFSCNLRNFKPDTARLNAAGIEVEDISAQTIPEDFARNPRIHRCYLVRAMD